MRELKSMIGGDMILNREVLHNRVRLLGLLIFVLSLPFSRSINNIGIIVLTINWAAEGSFLEKFKNIRNKPFVYYFTSIVVLSILGLIHTQNMHQGLFELEKRVTLLLFPLIFSTSQPISKKEIRLVFKMFILACFFASMICIAYAFYRNHEEHNLYTWDFDYFNYYFFTYYFLTEPIGMHPIYLAMYTILSNCLIIWLWWDKSGFKDRIDVVMSLLIIYNFIVIVLLSSRTQLFSMALIAIIFTLYYSFLKKKLIKGILFLVLLTSVSIVIIIQNPIIYERFTKAITPGAHYSENEFGEGGLSLRLYKWKYATLAIQDNFLVGVGTGDTQDVLQEVYKENNFKIGYENEFNPHNQYLQTTLEQGLVGLFVLLASFLVPLYYSYKKRVWIYAVFIVILLIAFLTESTLELNKGIVFYSFFNSLFAFEFLSDKP